MLRKYEREKRLYMKRKMSFWDEGGKKEAAKRVVRVSTIPIMDDPAQTAHLSYTHSELKKMKVMELFALLAEQTGKIFNKTTRKQDLIEAYLAAQVPREN